jgi:hypothetical protein
MKGTAQKLTISLEGSEISLFTRHPSYSAIAKQYQRVVIGQRGPYVEFTKNQIFDKSLYIPKNQLYRLSDPKVYYIEFRTIENDIKVYYQMRSVAYADYLINHFYISPLDLYKEDGTKCIRTDIETNENLNEFFEFNN